MTGPGEGKIRLDASVELCSRTRRIAVDCDVYLHVKGYSMARVTHLDLEAGVLNELVEPGASMYCPCFVEGEGLVVKLRTEKFSRTLGISVRSIRIGCRDLVEALGRGARSWVYVGGKRGGIFLGFKKEFLEKLEKLAVELGVVPRTGRRSDSARISRVDEFL